MPSDDIWVACMFRHRKNGKGAKLPWNHQFELSNWPWLMSWSGDCNGCCCLHCCCLCCYCLCFCCICYCCILCGFVCFCCSHLRCLSLCCRCLCCGFVRCCCLRCYCLCTLNTSNSLFSLTTSINILNVATTKFKCFGQKLIQQLSFMPLQWLHSAAPPSATRPSSCCLWEPHNNTRNITSSKGKKTKENIFSTYIKICDLTKAIPTG